MHPVYVGTCGWSYKDWAGVFYPAGLKPADFLPYLADQYPIVEVDSTFYATPAAKVVDGWRDKTPDEFGFALKVPQVITHEKQLAGAEDELAAFLGVAARLGDKLRCCLLQFGYFKAKEFPDLDAFLARLVPFLRAWPAEVPVAVEVRNPKWVTERLADALRSRGAVWALADQAYMPPLLKVLDQLDPVTGPLAYVRLLGDRTEVDRRTKTLDRIVIDRADQVADDAAAIARLAGRVPVLAFVNNHFAGHAPETVRQLREALRRWGIVFPERR